MKFHIPAGQAKFRPRFVGAKDQQSNGSRVFIFSCRLHGSMMTDPLHFQSQHRGTQNCSMLRGSSLAGPIRCSCFNARFSARCFPSAVPLCLNDSQSFVEQLEQCNAHQWDWNSTPNSSSQQFSLHPERHSGQVFSEILFAQLRSVVDFSGLVDDSTLFGHIRLHRQALFVMYGRSSASLTYMFSHTVIRVIQPQASKLSTGNVQLTHRAVSQRSMATMFLTTLLES